jgi:hypothetical protein
MSSSSSSPEFPSTPPSSVVHVWPKAATPRLRYLYTGVHVQGHGMVVLLPDGTPGRFRSVDLAFAAHKMFYLTNGAKRPDLAMEFAVGGPSGALTGIAQARAGGKTALKTHGLALDASAWAAVRVAIMARLVFARAGVDPLLITYCRQLVKEGSTIRFCSYTGELEDYLHIGDTLSMIGEFGFLP